MRRKIFLSACFLLLSCGGPVPQLPKYDMIDVSHHQGRINWRQVARFTDNVYIKATEGKTWVDPLYAENLEKARQAGLRVGSYHYLRTTSRVEDQFANFLRTVPKEKQDLIPMVDCEEQTYWGKKEYVDSLMVFIKLVEKHYGKRPLIYSVNSFYMKNLQNLQGYPFMIGRYFGYPPVMAPGHSYTLWQYTDKGVIQGICKEVDLSRFAEGTDVSVLYMN